MLNESEVEAALPVDDAEEVVAPTPRRGKRKLLPADLPRSEVTY
nr:transposase [Pseudomonas syringae]